MVDKRVNYFDQQFLQINDFKDEQAYYVERERLPFKALTSPGIGEGLEVSINEGGTPQVTVDVGMAIDSQGRQIVLGEPQSIDIPEDMGNTLAVYVTYQEQETVLVEDEQSSLGYRCISELPSILIANNPPDESSLVLAMLARSNGTWTVNDAREYTGWKLPNDSDGGGGTLKYQSEEATAEFEGDLQIRGGVQVGEDAAGSPSNLTVEGDSNLTVEGAVSADSLELSGDLLVNGGTPIQFKAFPLTIDSTYFTVDFATGYSVDDWYCAIAGCQPNNRVLVGLCNSSINISTDRNNSDSKWHVVGGGRLDPSLVGEWSVNVMAIKSALVSSVEDETTTYESEDPVTTSPFTIPLGDSITLDLLHIPGDTFLMGSPDGEGYLHERPQHLVNVPTFLMGKYPVTREQWEYVVDHYDAADLSVTMDDVKTDYDSQPGADGYNDSPECLPVTYVNWLQAKEFCDRLTHHFRDQGLIFRLPTEAEWEYACRAGTTTQYYYGDTVNESADVNVNCNGSGLDDISTVGSVGTPNYFGLYDMHGNVWEWCIDTYDSEYYANPQSSFGSMPCDTASDRVVVRGGSWGAFPSDCRSAYRGKGYPYNLSDYIGFRVVVFAPGLSST